MSKNLIIQIIGGIGKNIAATAVVENYKKQFPDSRVSIVTAWEDIWMNNNSIDDLLNINSLEYFYDKCIKNKDVDIVINDPYNHSDYIKGTRHLIDVWCELCSCEYDENIMPKIVFNKSEIMIFSNKIQSDKPILFLQTNGGAEGQGYSWSRDIPSNELESIVKAYTSTHNIMHMRRPDQPKYFEMDYTFSIREWLWILNLSDKRILIDSFAQHAAAAFNLKSDVYWIGGCPDVVGYAIHNNILPQNKDLLEKPNKYRVSKLFNIVGDPKECPFQNETIFSQSY